MLTVGPRESIFAALLENPCAPPSVAKNLSTLRNGLSMCIGEIFTLHRGYYNVRTGLFCNKKDQDV